MTEPNVIPSKEAAEVTGPETTRGGVHCTPRVDIYENADEVVLLCDMPGVKLQDLDVRFEKGELSLHGKVQPRGAPAEYLQEEYGVGDYYRSFTISPDVDAGKIAAHYKDGVLTIHLPKQEKVKPRQITVKTG